MPKLPRSTSSATSSMASETMPSRPAKPHPDRLKIMHLFPDRPLGWPEANSDEVGQVGDSGLVWDGEPGAEVAPDRHSELLAGFHQAQERVPAIPADVAAGSAADLAPGYLGADVVLRSVGVLRDLRAVEHPE